jgi:hypothetical protein
MTGRIKMSDCNEYNNSVDSSELQPFQKNNYFYGKLMSVRDFNTEQEYMDGKRRLINRLVSGKGIVCGFQETSIALDIENTVKVTFYDGGVALDCRGNEIVVPKGITKTVYAEDNELKVSDVGSGKYLYLEFNVCLEESVPALSNASSCTEKCCSNRIKESFKVMASHIDPKPDVNFNCDTFSAEIENLGKNCEPVEVMNAIRRAGKGPCPGETAVQDPETTNVFIGTLTKNEKGTIILVPDTESGDYVFGNPFLAKLFACHMAGNNPHKVTAAETGAIVSIEGVKSPGGNINLVPGNSIRIKGKPSKREVFITEEHSSNTGNPHNTEHKDLKSVLGADPKKKNTKKDKHISNEDANRWDSAVYNINDKSPKNGNFKIEAGNNITIDNTLDSSIKISSAANGGGKCITGVIIFKDILKYPINRESDKIMLAHEDALPFGIILGIEIKEVSLNNLPVVLTGDYLRELGVSLTSLFFQKPFCFIVAASLSRDSQLYMSFKDNKKTELTVRWWAIMPTENSAAMVSRVESRLGSDTLRREIFFNPGITLKMIQEKYRLSEVKINEMIEPMILSDKVKILSGNGLERKLSIVSIDR